MHKVATLSNAQVISLATEVAKEIEMTYHYNDNGPIKLYGVPRGGIPAMYAVLSVLVKKGIDAVTTDSPLGADYIIDDLVDSGKTRERYARKYSGTKFLVLLDKTSATSKELSKAWVVFPWENNSEGSFEDNVVRLLQYVGEDPERGGLLETPGRVAKAWRSWCSGYGQDPAEVLKVFDDGAKNYDEMVMVKDLPFYSHCEHHLAPFFGTASIAYIPDGKIVGLSKLQRLLDVFARRLQVQERLTVQVADALVAHLQPKGVAVRMTARHMCMESRGICKQGHSTITTALRGSFLKPESRSEFLSQA